MRKAAAIVAILACVVYTTLATWHGVLNRSAQPQAVSAEAALELSLKMAFCHGNTVDLSSSPDASQGTPTPADQSANCPVCKGLAACQFLLVPVAELGAQLRLQRKVHYQPYESTATTRARITQRSRGPPTSA